MDVLTIINELDVDYDDRSDVICFLALKFGYYYVKYTSYWNIRNLATKSI